ncbi:AMP-binding protein [Bosea sp. (in: a-proteobacteria)]|uniref:AMP-binding protein n=1 Tax=Bosea sp. (in: a-proteobacteria) TaxID=1871050 RepID=UPI002FC9ED80
MDDVNYRPWGASDLTTGALLDQRSGDDGDFTYALVDGRPVTVRELAQSANRVANALSELGVRQGDRVCLMLDNHFDHVIVFFALLKLGACMVPVNIHLRGDGLRFILEHSRPRAWIADARFAEQLQPLAAALDPPILIWRGKGEGEGAGIELQALLRHQDATARPCPVSPDDLAALLFTSGTTGLPKAVMVTDRMLRCSAHAAARMTSPRPNDVFYAWEPLYHIGGSEVLVLALQHRITLAMVPRFSVSNFWSEARAFGATHIHFLGGVLALLLKQPEKADDRDHRIRLAWGGGCPPAVWQAFQERFGIPIHDSYGMTEASSFTTQNRGGKIGSIGSPVPWFEVAVVDDAGQPLGPRERGELRIRERIPGLLTKGYFGNPAATATLRDDEWLCTGDIGYRDEDGDYYFVGRKKDSIRRRGENITAFEIERIANEHPQVAESAALGIANDLGDEDVMIVLALKPGATLEPLDFIGWTEGRMAYFQVPRFVSFVAEFAKTPSERIRKDALSRSTDGVFDLEKSGYRLQRR